MTARRSRPRRGRRRGASGSSARPASAEAARSTAAEEISPAPAETGPPTVAGAARRLGIAQLHAEQEQMIAESSRLATS